MIVTWRYFILPSVWLFVALLLCNLHYQRKSINRLEMSLYVGRNSPVKFPSPHHSPRWNRWNRTHPIGGGRVWSLRKLSIPSGTTRITEEGAKCVNTRAVAGPISSMAAKRPAEFAEGRRIDALSPPRRDYAAEHPLTVGRRDVSDCKDGRDGTRHASRTRAGIVAPGHVRRRDCGKQPE